MRRVYAVALIAGLSLTLFACKSDADPDTPPATTPPANPVDLLKKSLSTLTTTPAHQVNTVETSVGSTVTEGDVDIPEKTVTVTLKVAQTTIEVRLIGQDLYLKASSSDRWKHFDVAKIPADNDIKSALEVDKNLAILPGIVSANQVSPGKFEGTADLQKAADAAGTASAKAELQSDIELAGDKAHALPFTASLDDQGRLLSLSWSITSSKGTTKTTLAFSDWGKPITVAKPPANLTDEATAADYERF